MAIIVNNPNTLGVPAVTFDEFTFDRWRVQLRRAKKGSTIYHWTRSLRRYPYDENDWIEPDPHLEIGGITLGLGSGVAPIDPMTQWTKAVGLPNSSWGGRFSMYASYAGRFLERKRFVTSPM